MQTPSGNLLGPDGPHHTTEIAPLHKAIAKSAAGREGMVSDDIVVAQRVGGSPEVVGHAEAAVARLGLEDEGDSPALRGVLEDDLKEGDAASLGLELNAGEGETLDAPEMQVVEVGEDVGAEENHVGRVVHPMTAARCAEDAEFEGACFDAGTTGFATGSTDTRRRIHGLELDGGWFRPRCGMVVMVVV